MARPNATILYATLAKGPKLPPEQQMNSTRHFMRELNRLGRGEALRLYTQGSSWFSGESGKKGAIATGQLADFIALTDDYFAVAEKDIKGIESVLTVVAGAIVHATEEFSAHAPPPIPVLPEWSPVKVFGGYGAPLNVAKAARAGVPVGETWLAELKRYEQQVLSKRT